MLHFKPQHCISLRNSSQRNPKLIQKLLKASTATVKWLLLGPLSVPDLIRSGSYMGSCVVPTLFQDFPFETWIISCKVLPPIQSYLFLLKYFAAENQFVRANKQMFNHVLLKPGTARRRNNDNPKYFFSTTIYQMSATIQ